MSIAEAELAERRPHHSAREMEVGGRGLLGQRSGGRRRKNSLAEAERRASAEELS